MEHFISKSNSITKQLKSDQNSVSLHHHPKYKRCFNKRLFLKKRKKSSENHLSCKELLVGKLKHNSHKI